MAVWNAVNSGCVITPDTASSGVMTGKNVTVPGQCNGSMVFSHLISTQMNDLYRNYRRWDVSGEIHQLFYSLLNLADTIDGEQSYIFASQYGYYGVRLPFRFPYLFY